MAPRVSLTVTPVLGPYPSLPVTANSLDVTFAAADASDKNQFTPSDENIVLAWNTDAVNPYTFTITSVADPLNRTGDISTYSVGAGEIAAFRVKPTGFLQTDGKIYLEASNAAIKFAVLRL